MKKVLFLIHDLGHGIAKIVLFTLKEYGLKLYY